MKKIYIVDDDRNIVESMSIVLKKNGYEVLAQHDEENLEHNLRNTKPDLLILDVMFPEDSSAGFHMARRIKNDPTLAGIPILMLSAVNEKGIYVGKFSDKDLDDSFLPVNMFLEKPVSPTNLLEKVGALIKK